MLQHGSDETIREKVLCDPCTIVISDNLKFLQLYKNLIQYMRQQLHDHLQSCAKSHSYQTFLFKVPTRVCKFKKKRPRFLLIGTIIKNFGHIIKNTIISNCISTFFLTNPISKATLTPYLDVLKSYVVLLCKFDYLFFFDQIYQSVIMGNLLPIKTIRLSSILSAFESICSSSP